MSATSEQIDEDIGRCKLTAKLERFFLDLARRQVLSLGERTAAAIAKEQLSIWSARAHSSGVAEEEEAECQNAHFLDFPTRSQVRLGQAHGAGQKS